MTAYERLCAAVQPEHPEARAAMVAFRDATAGELRIVATAALENQPIADVEAVLGISPDAIDEVILSLGEIVRAERLRRQGGIGGDPDGTA